MSDDLWQTLWNKYTRYNQYVDVAACWESALVNHFLDNDQFKFYRFPPKHHTISGNEYTPDFSVKINDEYGITFEIKRTIGGGDEGFEQAVEQLSNYLDDIDYISEDIDFPDNKNVVLLVKENNARTIASKIRDMLKKEEIDDENLVILEYFSDQIDSLYAYKFRKIYPHSPDFNSNYFVGDNPLNEVFGRANDYEGIKVPTKYFWPYRVRCPFMNDSPPEVYFAALLWENIFYKILTPDQQEKIRISSGYQHIEIDTHHLKDLVDEEFNFQPRICTINSTMDFLVAGNLAREGKEDEMDYIVKYHRLKSKGEVLTHQHKEKERKELDHMCKKFIKYYIDNKMKEAEKSKERTKSPKDTFQTKFSSDD